MDKYIHYDSVYKRERYMHKDFFICKYCEQKIPGRVSVNKTTCFDCRKKRAASSNKK